MSAGAHPYQWLMPNQQTELLRLATALEARVEHARASDERSEQANVFGVLGPRGAGKSTLVKAFAWAAHGGSGEEPWITACRALRTAKLRVCDMIDCSALPEQVTPAAAVLVNIHRDTQIWPDSVKRPHPLRRELWDLVGAHNATDPAFRELCLELSTTQDGFLDALTAGLADRLELANRLRAWLDKVSGELEIDGFVIPLDDFDLVSGDTTRRWMQSLLDVLHQPRLLFVLAADLRRLEHVSLDREAQIDDETGRKLIQKMMPPEHRIVLQDFCSEDCQGFRPTVTPARVPATAAFGRAVVPEAPRLGELLIRRTQDMAPLRDIAVALAPRFPRGLGDLYASLARDLAPGVAESTAGDSTATDFLTLLAYCRSESLLARRVLEVAVEDWLPELMRGNKGHHDEVTDGVASADAWRRTVTAAREPARVKPLLDLAPARVDHVRRSGDPLTHDPTWTDPLRHDHFLVDPLRDARSKTDRALWAELLIDRALLTMPRERARLLDLWAPARERIARTCFTIDISAQQVLDFFRDERVRRHLLPWFKWTGEKQPDGALHVQIGWVPLLAHLRAIADPWPAALLKHLLIGPSDLQGRLRLPPEDERLDLLPGRVRHLIVLVDSLHRCPWTAYSTPRLGWSLLTYVRLARAFVRAAYVDALSKLRLVDASVLADWQLILSQLAQPEPGFGDDGRLDEDSALDAIVKIERLRLPEIPDVPEVPEVKGDGALLESFRKLEGWAVSEQLDEALSER